MVKNLKGFVFIFFFFFWTIVFSSCGSKGEFIHMTEDVYADATIPEEEIPEDVAEVNTSFVYVYVCGAVERPGVYEIAKDARIIAAVEAAGGMKATAAVDAVNLAGFVEDGMQIRIPTKGELANEKAQAQFGMDAEGRINLNTASLEQLMTLTGVGESKARAIISYREEHGDYHAIEDVMNIAGIKEGVFNKFKDEICVQ